MTIAHDKQTIIKNGSTPIDNINENIEIPNCRINKQDDQTCKLSLLLFLLLSHVY